MSFSTILSTSRSFDNAWVNIHDTYLSITGEDPASEIHVELFLPGIAVLIDERAGGITCRESPEIPEKVTHHRITSINEVAKGNVDMTLAVPQKIRDYDLTESPIAPGKLVSYGMGPIAGKAIPEGIARHLVGLNVTSGTIIDDNIGQFIVDDKDIIFVHDGAVYNMGSLNSIETAILKRKTAEMMK